MSSRWKKSPVSPWMSPVRRRIRRKRGGRKGGRSREEGRDEGGRQPGTGAGRTDDVDRSFEERLHKPAKRLVLIWIVSNQHPRGQKRGWRGALGTFLVSSSSDSFLNRENRKTHTSCGSGKSCTTTDSFHREMPQAAVDT
eukprot:1322119-Rhodomonas_salina.2